MPLHVDIRINEKLINTIHIGRLEGDTNPASLNTYKIVQGDRPTTVEEWLEGETFEHRYGDGAEVCVMKGLEALIYGQKI